MYIIIIVSISALKVVFVDLAIHALHWLLQIQALYWLATMYVAKQTLELNYKSVSIFIHQKLVVTIQQNPQ